MAKKKSKIAKALAAGLAAYGVAKMMGKNYLYLVKTQIVLEVHMTKLVYQC
jgi:hypothetical protein